MTRRSRRGRRGYLIDLQAASKGARLFFAFAIALAPALAQAQPQLPNGGSVAAGSATIGAPSGNTLNIYQSSSNAVINWNSFSVGQGYTVNFNQPGASSATLNRVNPRGIRRHHQLGRGAIGHGDPRHRPFPDVRLRIQRCPLIGVKRKFSRQDKNAVQVVSDQHCVASQVLRRSAAAYNLRVTGPENPGFRRIQLCLQALDRAIPSGNCGKVSSRFPNNSRFAETIGGDDSGFRIDVGSSGAVVLPLRVSVKWLLSLPWHF